NLTGADLSRARLKGANLKGANLTDAQLCLADLRQTLFDRYTKIDTLHSMRGANIDSAQAPSAWTTLAMRRGAVQEKTDSSWNRRRLAMSNACPVPVK